VSDADIVNWIAMTGFIASILDAVIPPSETPGIKQFKQLVSVIALNFGHSHNIAPSQAVKEAQ